ncbi:MAG: CvpA family protein [Candidatus Neomarinimicrobiota bacterium]
MIQFLDALAIFFIISSGAIGFRRGLLEELGRLLGLIFATIFSLNFYIEIGTFIIGWIKVDPYMLFILSFILSFSLILITIRMITKLIHYLFLSKSTNWVNRLLGTFFGMSKGILFVMIFFWIFEIIPNTKIKEIVNQKSIIADHLVQLRKTIVITFNFSDPIAKGEKTILNYLKTKEDTSG